MSELARDLRHAIRALRRNPGFALAAVLTLALGIGANTTIFSAVYAALLEAPPYPAPGELRLVTPVFDRGTQPPDTQEYWSYPMYQTFRRAATGAGEFAAFTPTPRRVNLAGEDAAQPVLVEMVSQPYFGILGLTPSHGRFFIPDEDLTPNAQAVAVLSDGLWRRAFGADPGVVGSTIRLDAAPFTVVGIAPPGFKGLSEQADLWVPMMMAPTLTFARRLTSAYSFWHMVLARVPAGSDPEPPLAAAARAMVDAWNPLQAFRATGLRLAAVPLQAARTDWRLGRALLVLLGAVSLVLLIAGANVAGLQLARALRRRRELGIRVALGVRRSQLVRQLLAESAVLATLGGVLGVILSAWGLDLLNALRPRALATVGGPGGAHLSAAVLLFAVAATAGATVISGLLPAWWAARADPLALIRTEAVEPHRLRLRGTLVAGEVALALVLLAGAVLLAKSVASLNRVPLGFNPQGVAVALINPPARAYPGDAGQRLFRETTRRLAALPGTRFAAAGYCLPIVGGCDQVLMTIERDVGTSSDPSRGVWLNMVDHGFLPALEIPLIAGRGILASDAAGSPAIALVSEAAARRYWPGESQLGQRIRLSVGWPEGNGWVEVVGVVGDVKFDDLREAAAPGVYLALSQFSCFAFACSCAFSSPMRICNGRWWRATCSAARSSRGSGRRRSGRRSSWRASSWPPVLCGTWGRWTRPSFGWRAGHSALHPHVRGTCVCGTRWPTHWRAPDAGATHASGGTPSTARTRIFSTWPSAGWGPGPRGSPGLRWLFPPRAPARVCGSSGGIRAGCCGWTTGRWPHRRSCRHPAVGPLWAPGRPAVRPPRPP